MMSVSIGRTRRITRRVFACTETLTVQCVIGLVILVMDRNLRKAHGR